MTYKRLTAMLLAFTMLFSIIVINPTAYAADEEIMATEEKETDVSTADYPIMIKGRINTARLARIGQFSKLADEEKNAVCEYYNLTDSVFIACESLGYNIMDSARIGKAANAANVTPAEYKEYVESYGSEEEASANLRGYRLHEDLLSDEYKTEFLELMKEGYEYSKLSSTYLVAKRLDTSMQSIVPDIPQIESYGTTELEKYAVKNFCDADKLQEVAEVQNVDISQLTAENISVQEISALDVDAELNSAATMSISDSVEINSPIYAQKNEFIASPSSYFAGENELVSTVTGGLNYREHIVELKGKNGLDLDLDLVFNANANMYWGVKFYYETDDYGNIIYENGNKLVADVLRYDWYGDYGLVKKPVPAPLGVGWSFNLPKITGTFEYDEDASNNRKWVLHYHPKSGGAYKVIADDDDDANTMELEHYPREDMQFTKVNANGARYKVTFKDGIYELYNSDGQIVEYGDRFGNKITYTYYIGYDNPYDEYFLMYEGALKTITDSLGRVIEIDYPKVADMTTSFDVIITLPDEEQIRLRLQADSVNDPYILYSIDNRPGYTTFSYVNTLEGEDRNGDIVERTRELYCTDEPFFEIVETDFDRRNEVLNIAEITYNTGLTSRYLHEIIEVTNGIGGVKEVMRVTERYELFNSGTATDISQIKKHTRYKYSDADYSGRATMMLHYGNSQLMEYYDDPNDLPETFEYWVGSVENSVETRTKNNNKHDVVYVSTLLIDEESENEDIILETAASEKIEYNAYELPAKITRTNFNYQNVEQFEYDNKGNVLKHWSVYADGEKNDEYATVYTYDGTYNLPLSVTYKRDADTTVTENYTLSTDKKTVTDKAVSENGTLKEKTQYEYDSYGNVTKERKYKNATQYIDINYDYTDTTGVTRPSNTSFGGAYLTKMWQSGGEDIDGNAIGNVEYTYEYDVMGNQTKVTDPLGNSTTYLYDRYRRVRQITNPDNTTQTIEPIVTTTANETTYTDEGGTRIKYIYDPANNLTDVIDLYDNPEDPFDDGGATLASYDYDRWYRLTKERNVQFESSGFETSYVYDEYSRVAEKETTDFKLNDPLTTVAKEQWSYDFGETNANYLITTHTIVGDNFAPSIVTKEYVNKHGDVEKTGYVTGNNEYFATYAYDYLGAKTSELAAIADQKDWTNEFTSKWDYDYAGRVLRQYNANNNYISYEYDWLGRVTKAYDAVANTLATPYYTAYLYDDLGNVIQETVPQTATTNKVTKYKYDKLGRVVLESRLHDILTGAEQYRSTAYEYDWRGNPTEVTQGGYFSTTYTYDDLGRCLTSTTDGKTTSYTYNRFGKVLTETFGGKTDTYEYDENMFRTKHIHPSGKIITYEPNAIGQTATIMTSAESGGRTFDYTLTGQLLQASDASYVGRIRREYDDRGNVIYEENTGLTKEYTYDISGKRESMIAEGSGDVQSLTYSYNNLEQLESVSGDTSAYYQYDANGNVVIAMENGHDEYSDYNRDNSPSYSTIFYLGAGASSYNTIYYLDGNIKSETFFDGTTKTYTYNTRNMLSSETFSTGKVVNYSYNPSGNRASMTETENGQSTVTEYVYDELNRLTRHYTESPNGDTDRTYYSYDEDGNLILRSRETATTGTATNTFSFGTSSPSVDTFKYNGYGEMSSSTVNGVTTNYTYYADGLRRTKTTNGVTTVHMWDGDNIIADLDGNYALKTGYARAHDLSTMYNADGDEWYYIMSDRGDTIQMYNDTTETNYLYDAYGNQQTETTSDINPFRYSGEYYDAETGFTYLRARYYDPTIGRFISEDPIRDGLNWYAYCENNPIMFVDPSGLIKSGDEKLDETLQVILNGEKKDGSGGLTLSWELAKERNDEKAMEEIARQAQILRDNFSVSNFNRVVILLDGGAVEGLGHTATLLLNKKDQGVLLSYYSQNLTATGPGETRITIFNSNEWADVVYRNKNVSLIGSNGRIRVENYSNSLCLTIEKDGGYAALKKMTEVFNNPGEYNLIYHNCDVITSSLVSTAGRVYDKQTAPVSSYNRTKLYHTDYWGWFWGELLGGG